MKRKKRNRKIEGEAINSHFSLRDAWDVMVIVMLLSVVVYFSNYARKYKFDLPAWPQIKHVSVDGSLSNVDPEVIKQVIKVHIAGGFFCVSMKKLEQDLKNIPWVYHATAQRYWPNSISVNIFEQKPIARWGESGLMNIYGDVFSPGSIGQYTSLPMLFGEQQRAKELATIFEESLYQLRESGLQLHGLFEDERQSKHLVLSDGMIIAIGDGDTQAKINRFTAAYEKYLSPNISKVKKIDLRYTNGLAVEWKDPQLAQNLKLDQRL